MNIWLIALIFMLISLLLVSFSVLRGNIMKRLAALQLCQIVTTLSALLLAEYFGRSVFFDVPLLMAILSFINLLIYLRFLERWL